MDLGLVEDGDDLALWRGCLCGGQREPCVMERMLMFSAVTSEERDKKAGVLAVVGAS